MECVVGCPTQQGICASTASGSEGFLLPVREPLGLEGPKDPPRHSKSASSLLRRLMACSGRWRLIHLCRFEAKVGVATENTRYTLPRATGIRFGHQTVTRPQQARPLNDELTVGTKAKVVQCSALRFQPVSLRAPVRAQAPTGAPATERLRQPRLVDAVLARKAIAQALLARHGP